MADTLQEQLSKHFTEQNLIVTDNGGVTGEGMTQVKTDPPEKKPVSVIDPNADPNKKPPPEGEKKTPGTEDNNSSLNGKEKPVETKVPTFEEMLSEKTAGKFKGWGDVEKILNEPKVEFADDLIKQINDLRKEGVQFNENWLYTVSRDYNVVDDPIELLSEKMRIDEPGITDAEIEYRIKKDYDTGNWSKEEGEEPTDVEKALGAKMIRDAEKAREQLIAYQGKLKLSPKQENETLKQQQAETLKVIQGKWNEEVEKTSAILDKISVKVGDENGKAVMLDIPVDKEESKKFSEIAKSLFSDPNALWNEFVDKKQPIGLNTKGLLEMITKAKMFDRAVNHARNEGAKSVVAGQKNINFNPDGITSATEKLTQEELQQKAIAQSIMKSGMY